MKIRKKLLLLLPAFIIFFAGCTNYGDGSLISTENSGKIEPLQNLSYDWEEINIEGGDVEQTFKFKNSGDEDLIIKSAVTTCMCTSATIELADGSVSPEFGMHSKNSWGAAVKPGEEFTVKVVFDPMAHGPNAVGPITRSVFMETSSVPNGSYAAIDATTGEMTTEMKLDGNVLYAEDYESQESNSSKSAFNFEELEFDFGVIKQSEDIISHDFSFEYTGEETIKVTGVPTSCACTEAKVSQEMFEKGDKGVLTVYFDPNLHEEPEGKFFKTINILTEPKIEDLTELKIWVEMDLDLGPAAYKLQEEHNDEVEEKAVYKNIDAKEFQGMLAKKDFFLLDVHIPEQDHIEGTDEFIPYNKIEENIDQLPKDKDQKIIVYCRSGGMSLEASQKLIDLGYTDVTNLQGGRNAYVELTK